MCLIVFVRWRDSALRSEENIEIPYNLYVLEDEGKAAAIPLFKPKIIRRISL